MNALAADFRFVQRIGNVAVSAGGTIALGFENARANDWPKKATGRITGQLAEEKPGRIYKWLKMTGAESEPGALGSV
jgi:hypothetical protein